VGVDGSWAGAESSPVYHPKDSHGPTGRCCMLAPWPVPPGGRASSIPTPSARLPHPPYGSPRPPPNLNPAPSFLFPPLLWLFELPRLPSRPFLPPIQPHWRGVLYLAACALRCPTPPASYPCGLWLWSWLPAPEVASAGEFGPRPGSHQPPPVTPVLRCRVSSTEFHLGPGT